MKNTNIKNLINDLLTEASLDPRIETGVFEVYNREHLDILEEYMISRGIDTNIISEFIDEIAMEEGKYPDRQAYNKEGWLVTFPSKEYRDKAIKRGTHSVSDPTHGKGGMNLYYKKRGKQKRQTTQAVTRVKPSAAQQAQKQKAATVDKPAPQPALKQPADAGKTPANGQAASKPSSDDSEEYYDDTSKSAIEKDNEKLRNAFGFGKKEPAREPAAAQPSQGEVPAIEVPVVNQAPVEYATISKKFVAQKGWTSTSHGEYRDAQGNTVAVVGLSGEIVPIKNTDREEYKLFAEKNMPQQQ